MKNTVLISTLLFGLLAFAGSASSATFKIATLAPEGTAWMNAFRGVAKEVSEKTEGRVKLKFFPGGVMGSDKSVLRKMRIKQLQGGALGISAMSDAYIGTQIYGLPFLFNSYDEVRHVRQYLDPIMAEGLEKKGYKLLALSEGGFAYMMSTNPVDKVEQIRQMKVWMPEGDDVLEKVYKGLGINPITLPVSDVYTGLQTGLVDMVGINPSGAIALQWHTKIKHFIDEPLLFVFGVMVVDKRAFNKLSQADQAVFEGAVKAAFAQLDESNKADDAKAKDALKAAGVSFTTLSDEESGVLRNAMKEAGENITSIDGFPSDVVKDVEAMLETYRQEKAAAP